jgi:protocatechuate 3,4-dioxygenase beta subunit
MKRLGIILCLLGLHASAQVNCITTPDQLGPYFKHGAPLITNDTLAPGVQDSSRALKLNFYVSYDCDTVDLDTLPSPYALELWHANAQGEYSNVDGNPNDFAYRGRLVLSGKTSTLYTELPGIYPWRPSHIHVKGFLTNAWFTDTIVTQLYFKGDS